MMLEKIVGRLKIGLIRPKYDSHLITPPLGLGYISSYLKAKGYETKVIDGLNHGYNLSEIANLCVGFDVVGINCLSAYFSQVVFLSRLLKKKGVKVVVGGAHASALPELTLDQTGADFVVVGEGEAAMAEIAESIENGSFGNNKICGTISRRDSNLVKRETIKDLDILPMPDWDQIDPRIYKKAPHGGLVKSFPVAPIISTRGCPFECTFCASPFLWDKRIRFRSPESVVNEIEYLTKRFNVREIHFEDDNLTLKRDHIEKICRLIIEKKIKINWATPNGIRVDSIDEDLLKLMKRSGCYFLAFGIESGNQNILERVKKKTDLAIIERVVKMVKKAGIVTQGFFIFGLPGETEKTILETIKFSVKLPLDKAQFLVLDVLPGSELWKSLGSKRLVEWDYKSYQEATWIPEGLTQGKLNYMVGCAFRKFFFRPRQIMFTLRYIKPGQIPFVIKRIMDFGVFNFSWYRKV